MGKQSMMQKMRIYIHDHMNSFRTILLGFCLLILGGAVLLSMPFASASGEPVPFIDALFTSVSASCVTGLVVYDTAVQWSLAGRTIILILIQIGGLGVITLATVTLILTGRQIGIMQRTVMQDAISAPQLGGILRLTVFFLKGTLLIEGLGAALLTPVFAEKYGLLNGFGHAVFNAVSAFCNAGFDLMGAEQPFASLTGWAGDARVNLVIMFLIVTGGLGFLTWQDLLRCRGRFSKLALQTKVILATTGVLLLIPFLYFYFLEFRNAPESERLLLAMFQTVTPRTAGFSTTDYAAMSEGGLLVTIVLMLTGGAPGSTAGGMKVTTVYIVALSVASFLRRRENVSCFSRRIEEETVREAMYIMVLYLTLLFLGSIAVSGAEKIPVLPAMFECASALGTVGLTTGITPGLCAFSKIILILFMYAGRVGGLTLAYAMALPGRREKSRFPVGKVAVG
ncbi:MAG: Trk family potassium uptake protein [Solobacterium sp.]|nr:Trk family potassium uptake protein [Solobacterium sp.]